MATDWEQYRADTSANATTAPTNINWEQYRAPADSNAPVKTFLGTLPGNPFKVPLGSDQSFVNPSTISDFMNGVAGQGGINQLAGGVGMLGKGAVNVAKSVASDISPLEQKFNELTQGHEADKAALNQATQEAQAQTGKGSEGQLQFGKSNAEGTLGQTPEMSVVNNPVATGQNVEQATAAHETALSNKDSVQSDLDSSLNKNAAHDVQAAARVDTLQNATKKDIGKVYDEVEGSLAGKNITIKNPETAAKIADDLKTLISKGGLNTPEAKALADKLGNFKESTEIPARDYLASYRTVRDYARQANQEAYKPGITDEARQEAKARAAELDAKTEDMRGVLEDGIGAEDSAKLRDANKRWSTEVTPLYKNKVYNQIRYQGRMPDNIVKQLRGTDPGNVLLRKIIQNDPEANRNVIGQRYQAKPSEVHQPNANMQEYLNAAPDIQEKLANHAQATQDVDEAVEAKKQAEATHQNALSQNAERQKNEDKRAALQDKISKFDQHIANLEKLRSQKDISLSQKVKAERDLKIAKDAKAKAWHTMKLGAKGIVYPILGYGGARAINGISSLVNNAGEE